MTGSLKFQSYAMKIYDIPVAEWSVKDVQEWLTDIGLGKLNEAIEHNAGMLLLVSPLLESII